MTHTFNTLIVEIDVRDLNVWRQSLGADCKAVIV
jgi:hypothetical protein